MSFNQFADYLTYFAIFTGGIIMGRLSMAIQYAIMKPKPK